MENDANDSHGTDEDDISTEAESVADANPDTDSSLPETGATDSTEEIDDRDDIQDSDTSPSTPDA